MAERAGEALNVLRCGERDDGDLTPGGLNLVRMHAELGQVILAKEAAQMAEKDQHGGVPEQPPGGKRVARDVAQVEVELDSRHRELG